MSRDYDAKKAETDKRERFLLEQRHASGDTEGSHIPTNMTKRKRDYSEAALAVRRRRAWARQAVASIDQLTLSDTLLEATSVSFPNSHYGRTLNPGHTAKDAAIHMADDEFLLAQSMHNGGPLTTNVRLNPNFYSAASHTSTAWQQQSHFDRNDPSLKHLQL